MRESSPPEDEYDRLDSPGHAGTLGDTLSGALDALLVMDLTFENSDDSAVRHKGRMAAQRKKDELKTLSRRERDWLLSELVTALSKQPASLATACWILGRPVPPSPQASPLSSTGAQHASAKTVSQPAQPVSAPITSTGPTADSGAQPGAPGLLRRLLQRLRNRRRAARRESRSQKRTVKARPGTHLPSRRDARPGPEHTNSLRAMLANPVMHRGPLLNNLFYAGSVPVEASWKPGKNGRREHAWSSERGLYRTHRPGTLGDPELLRTEVRIEPLRSGCWRVTTRQSVPLYAEDVGWRYREFPTLEEATRYAEEFLADRFRIIREEVLELLIGLSSDDSMKTPHEAHTAVLDLTANLLGEEYRSPCASLVGLWDKTLRAFLDEVRKQEPGAVETYFALLPGWTLGKKELKSTVKRLVNSDDPAEESRDS